MTSDCPACREGHMTWQAETVSRVPVHYLRCSHCGTIVKPGGKRDR